MRQLKQSTTRNVTVLIIDSADHITGKAGLTLTITASKDGAAFASITPTVTDLGSGFYNLAFTTTHTNTLGDLALHITATGADPYDEIMQVLVDLPGGTVASVTGAVGSVTAGVTLANGAITTAKIAAGAFDPTVFSSTAEQAFADAMLDRDMSSGTDSGSESVRTPRQALRALRNKVDIPNGKVKKEDDTTDSWTFTTTTAAGNPVTVVDPT